ncbi:hypothetical protein BH23ACT9_BH23ACT9_25350 [soil metagenome]
MDITADAGQRSIYDPATRRIAVTVGLLFLTATLTFTIGDSLIRSAFSTDAGGTDTTTLIVGVVLQAICGLAVAAIGLALLRILGMIGYAAILLAIPSDLFGIVSLGSPAGTLFYVPGGAFEVILPILLIARGFRRPDAHLKATGIDERPLATVSP